MEVRHALGEGDLQEKENVKDRWILEVGLEYPVELHQEHNSYPLAPEKKVMKKSDYQKSLLNDLELKLPDSEKLLLKLRLTLPKLAVLSETGHKTEKRTQGAGVRTRMLDGTAHPDQHRIQKKRSQRLR